MLRLLLFFALGLLLLIGVGALRGAFKDGFLSPLQARGGPTFSDHAIGLVLACAYVAVLLATAHTLGFMRDEGMYFDASKSYAGWFEKLLSADKAVRASAFTEPVVDAHWAPNGEHPSLIKGSFALSWIYLWKTWPQGLIELFSRSALTKPIAWCVLGVAKIAPKLFTEESASFRFPGMVTGGLVLYVTYLFAAEVGGRAAGLCAALLYAGIPRAYFDAHLAAFDAAAVLAWVGCAYAYWRGLRSMGWAMAAGVVWGLALLTKHNSWFLPVVFLVHYVWLAYDTLRARAGAHPTFHGRLRRLPIPWPFLFMGMFGPAIFVYGWPRLWFDTWSRIDWYFGFHARHDFYNIEYLHKTYFQPPFPISMPYVLIFATVPLAALVAMVIGVCTRFRAIFAAALPATSARVDDDRRTAFFWFFNLNLPIAIIAHPKVPHFGGTKHWHPAYPFLCMFGGLGIVFCARALARAIVEARANRASLGQPASMRGIRAEMPSRTLMFVAVTGIAALCITPGLIEAKQSHPHGLSYYTPIVGGPSGGASLGLNRGFWGYEPGAIVDWLNVHLPHGGHVYPNDMYHSSFEQLRLDGRLHQDIESEFWTPANADVAVVEHEQHMDEVEHQIWVAFGTLTPAYVVTLEGAPVMTVYVNPKSTRFVP